MPTTDDGESSLFCESVDYAAIGAVLVAVTGELATVNVEVLVPRDRPRTLTTSKATPQSQGRSTDMSNSCRRSGLSSE
jgi:hypothetical protein